MVHMKVSMVPVFLYVIFAEIKGTRCSNSEVKCAYRSIVSDHRHFYLSNKNQTCVPFGKSDLALQSATYAQLLNFSSNVPVPLFGAREKRGPIYDRYMTGPSNTTIWTTWSSSEAASLASAGFYRSPLLDIWAQIKWKTVEVELYAAGVAKTKLVFNATGSTIGSWFSRESLIDSWPWILTEITTPTNYNTFSAYGLLNPGSNTRRFAIMVHYNGCPGDYGAMAVFDDIDNCPFVSGTSYNLPQPSLFLYSVSPTNGLGTFSTHKAYADEFRISATANFSDQFIFDKK